MREPTTNPHDQGVEDLLEVWRVIRETSKIVERLGTISTVDL
jgi:hypothetical protein